MCLVPARFLAHKAADPTGTGYPTMLLRTTAALTGLLALVLGADVAGAQGYPPYYQAPPQYYRGAPPAAWDIDDMPVGTVPGDIDRPATPAQPAPRANAAPDPYAAYRPPYGGPPPYPDSGAAPGAPRDPYALPPPGIDPYQQRPVEGAAVQPGGQPDSPPGTMRPPGAIGGEQQVASLP